CGFQPGVSLVLHRAVTSAYTEVSDRVAGLRTAAASPVSTGTTTWALMHDLPEACKRNAFTGYGNHCSHQPGSRPRKRIALPAACPTGVPQTAGSAVCRPADAVSGCEVLACVDRRIAGRAHGTSAAGGYARRGWKDRAQPSRMPAPVAAS